MDSNTPSSFPRFKHKNFICRYFLKLTNREGYKFYKKERNAFKYLERLNEFNEKIKFFNNPINYNNVISFKHSGHTGDVIYSLPTVKALSKARKANLYLNPNVQVSYKPLFKKTHPYGTVQLTDNAIKMLIPLIKAQSYIDDCKIFNDEEITHDLDEFRASPLFLDRGCIMQWYFHFFGVTYNLSCPWLHVSANPTFKDSIIIARSFRYRNIFINYIFLNKYKKIFFVGVEEEYLNMREQIHSLEWIKVENFLEMAEAIAGCKLFIGNQSFPFSLAEGLKVTRILEICPENPNVIPAGDNAYSFYFQKEFEFLTNKLLSG